MRFAGIANSLLVFAAATASTSNDPISDESVCVTESTQYESYSSGIPQESVQAVVPGLETHLPCPEEHLIYFQNNQVSKIVIDSQFEFWDDFPFDYCFEHLLTSPTDFLSRSHRIKAKYVQFTRFQPVEWAELFNLLALNSDLERLKIYVNQETDFSGLSELRSLETLEVRYNSEEAIDNVVDYLSENRPISLMHVKFGFYGSNHVFLKRTYWSEASSRLGLKVSPPVLPPPIICPYLIKE